MGRVTYPRNSKKAEIAAALEAAFFSHGEVPAEVTAEGRAAALAWVPPGFAAFDTGGAEENDGAETGAEEPDAPPPPGNARAADGTAAEAAPDRSSAGAPEDDGETGAKASEPSAVETAAADSASPPSDPERRVNPAAPAAEDGDSRPDPATPTAEVGNAGVNGAGPADAPADHDAARFVIEGGGKVHVQRERVLAPVPGNGRDDGEDLLEIPAFLRRTP